MTFSYDIPFYISHIYWFLELGHYLIEFIQDGEKIDLFISPSDDSMIKEKEVYKISGNYESIVFTNISEFEKV